MAKLPEIDQELFWNDQLGLCPPLARLLWIGLHLLAGENGRVETRPFRFRAQLLPYDEADVDKLLDELGNQGLISTDYDQLSGTDYIVLEPLHRLKVPETPQINVVEQVIKSVSPLAEEKAMDQPAPVAVEPIAKARVEPPYTSGVMTWLQPENAKLIRSWRAEGKTMKELAKLMGVQSKTVCRWAREYPAFGALVGEVIHGRQSDLPKWLEPQNASQIRVWVAEGLTKVEIARRIGKPDSTIATWIRKSPEFAALFETQETPQPEPEQAAEEPAKQAARAVVLSPEYPLEAAPLPDREPPGYLKWLEPEKAEQIRKWVSDGLLTAHIAKRMGISPSVLTQWKVMSTEFASLFVGKRKLSLGEAVHREKVRG